MSTTVASAAAAAAPSCAVQGGAQLQLQPQSSPPSPPPPPHRLGPRLGPRLRASSPCRLQQRPVSVTLDGPTIVALALALVLLMHFLGSPPTEVVVGLTPVFLLVRNDYRNFVRLGPGGTPSTVAGYLRISWLRLWAIRDPFVAPRPDPTDPDRVPTEGILRRRHAPPLPYRAGPRPLVAGIAPQRQLDQSGSQGCYHALRRAMERLATRCPLQFGTERSCLEKHGLALFARHPLHTICQGEICHVHDSDRSMHMCLHPDDIAEVLSKGWGQRHPLARRRSLLPMPVSPDFVMVYAPRNEHELGITYRIIEAAIWYVLAERVEFDAFPSAPEDASLRDRQRNREL